MHPLYVTLHEVMWYDAWLYGCTQNMLWMAAVSSCTSHVRTKQHCNYTTWVNIQSALQPKPLCACHLNHGTLTDAETVTLQPKPLCAHHLNHGTLTDVETVTLQPKPLCACHLNHGTITDVETVTLQPKPPKGESVAQSKSTRSQRPIDWLSVVTTYGWITAMC